MHSCNSCVLNEIQLLRWTISIVLIPLITLFRKLDPFSSSCVKFPTTGNSTEQLWYWQCGWVHYLQHNISESTYRFCQNHKSPLLHLFLSTGRQCCSLYKRSKVKFMPSSIHRKKQQKVTTLTRLQRHKSIQSTVLESEISLVTGRKDLIVWLPPALPLPVSKPLREWTRVLR